MGLQIDLDDKNYLTRIGKALSVEVRLDILRLLKNKQLNINEIAETLAIPASSAALHIRVLEDAGLIKTMLMPGVRGSMKQCKIAMDSIFIQLDSAHLTDHIETTIDMPIGNYVDYQVEPTCGIVSEKGPIGEEDEPRVFYHPQRSCAKLLWLSKGYLEYRFPNDVLRNHRVEQIEISMEVCSEDHEYNMDFPSDITVWINDREVGTWTCPGDFGDRRGRLNPKWWPDKNTQYGTLKTWCIKETGCFIDQIQVDNAGIAEFDLERKDYIAVRVGIKPDAIHNGGMNLFGDRFGDYAQNIQMRLILL